MLWQFGWQKSFSFFPESQKKKSFISWHGDGGVSSNSSGGKFFCWFIWKMYLFPRACRGVSAILLLKASAVILTTPYELLRGSHFSSFICMIFNTFFLSLRSHYSRSKKQVSSQCLKITQNVAFEFLNFGIFHQFLSY